jgi:murein L,D-transpeptidase YcbB/YkuD
MKRGALTGSKRVLRAASLAVLMIFAVSVAAPAISRADADSSEFAQSNRKKKFGDAVTVTTNATGAAHSQGSGLKATTETQLVVDGTVSPFLTPDSPAAMQAMVSKYQQIVSAGGWPRVPAGNQKKGDTGKGPEALNQRLFIEGYLRAEATQGEYAQVFTTATEDALKRFQRNNGLAVTGVIDGPTLNALNVPADRRLNTLRANVARIAEYSKDLGPRYVVVNVPAQQIEAISDGRVYSLHNAIVGRPSRPTPVVMTPLKTIRFNPYWNAPASIVEKDILPRMLSSGPSKVMREMNMKIFDGVGGPEVDPDSVDWRRAVVDDYHFRQEPGGSNAMATAKIEFTSPFGIYLHDTPEPQLFQTGQRFYSSGCVRVEKVAILINWILQGQDGIDQNRIAELARTKERLDKEIANPPQLRVAYLTAWPTRDGVAAFRDDIYELDGTGFVVGQPLPVGETQGGQRFVLKPIPRLQEDIDTNDGIGLASLFRFQSRNDDKHDGPAPGQGVKAGDSLVTVSSAKEKPKAKTAAKVQRQPLFGKRDGSASETALFSAAGGASATGSKGKTGLDRKAADKSKVATANAKAKKVLKKDQAEVAAKKPGDSAVAEKKKALAEATQTAAKAKPPADAKPASDKKPAAASCKPASDGKLPEGCKPAAAAKKPPVKPEKTASAATPAAN